MKMLSVCVCVCAHLGVNQGGTNRNCIHRDMHILHTQTY